MKTKEYLITNGPNDLGLIKALFMRRSKSDDPDFRIKEKDGDGTKRFTLHCRILSVATKDGFKKWEIKGFAYYRPKKTNSEMVKVRLDFEADYDSHDRAGFLRVLKVHN